MKDLVGHVLHLKLVAGELKTEYLEERKTRETRERNNVVLPSAASLRQIE